MSHAETEIATQPDCWRQAIDQARQPDSPASVLPRSGERVAVVGCGTSLFMAQAYAAMREGAGAGETDAFAASEALLNRRYDRLVALTRTGTTSEVVDVLRATAGRIPTVVVTADPDTPAVEAADEAVLLDFADEESILQTRYATTQLVLLRAHLGLSTDGLIEDARSAIAAPLPPDLFGAEQFTFLGRGWGVGVAFEAAHKMREGAGMWTEAYPAMEYNHGGIAVAGPNRVVWCLGPPPAGLADTVTDVNGRFVSFGWDPLADLVMAQRLTVALADRNGLDPDHPRHLVRSVILTGH